MNISNPGLESSRVERAIAPANSPPEIGVADIFDMLWRGRLAIVMSMLACLAIGVAAWLLLPRTYESVAEIRPINQAQYSNFLALAGVDAFPYDARGLLSEYEGYLRDPGLLFDIARQSGIVDKQGLSDAVYQQRLREFVTGIAFPRPDEQAKEPVPTVRMNVRADDQQALYRFVEGALNRASAELSNGLRFEVAQNLSARKEEHLAQIEEIRLDIDSRRERVKAERADTIERLIVQARIARSFGLDKPYEMQAIESREQAGGVFAQINSGAEAQPHYFRGYIAIEQQIELLRSRKDNDPFVADLRELEQKVYLLENDPRSAHVNRLLAESLLANQEGGGLVRYSVPAAAGSNKVFPRLSIFGPASLAAGLLIGCLIAFAQTAYRRRTA